MGRRWVTPRAAPVTFSALLPPGGVPAGLLGWMPLLAGVADASALQETAGVDATEMAERRPHRWRQAGRDPKPPRCH
jgi:biotin-(acetyl-CoA carboxylase) ligase